MVADDPRPWWKRVPDPVWTFLLLFTLWLVPSWFLSSQWSWPGEVANATVYAGIGAVGFGLAQRARRRRREALPGSSDDVGRAIHEVARAGCRPIAKG